jgi:hypothetical protein
MKQTAVEWLQNELFTEEYMRNNLFEIFEHAKELEKQQMLHFWQGGLFANESGGKNFETYYNETYKPST